MKVTTVMILYSVGVDHCVNEKVEGRKCRRNIHSAVGSGMARAASRQGVITRYCVKLVKVSKQLMLYLSMYRRQILLGCNRMTATPALQQLQPQLLRLCHSDGSDAESK